MNGVVGEIQSIDRTARRFVVKPTAGENRTFSYRDDTKLVMVTGSSIRFDEFGEASGGLLPVSKGDKVTITWRMSANGKDQIADTVQKTP